METEFIRYLKSYRKRKMSHDNLIITETLIIYLVW